MQIESLFLCDLFAFIVSAMGVKGWGLGMLIMDTAYLGVTV